MGICSPSYNALRNKTFIISTLITSHQTPDTHFIESKTIENVLQLLFYQYLTISDYISIKS